MAGRYNVHDAVSTILHDDFGLSDSEESNLEGEEVCGYHLECRPNLSVRDDHKGNVIEEDGEAMGVESHFRPEERVMDSDSSKSTLSEDSYKVGDGEAGDFSCSSSSSAPSSGRGSSALEMLSPASSPEPSTGGEVDFPDYGSSGDSSGSGREHEQGHGHGRKEGLGRGRGRGRRRGHGRGRGRGRGMGGRGGMGGGEGEDVGMGVGLLDSFHQMRSCMDPGRRKVLGYRYTFTGGELVLLHLLMTVYLWRTFFKVFYRGCLEFADGWRQTAMQLRQQVAHARGLM